MKSRYDPEADALYVSFSDAPIIESEEVRPGIIFDYDADGRVVGIEVLDATEHLSGGADLRTLSVCQGTRA